MTEVETYDVIILGGGINGCGTYRDLCAQGVRCLLIEREDFCAGASAASSRLMHGGLKYLETGEFRLVTESLTERNMLLQTAAHLVQPLECVVPVRSVFGGIIGSVARFFGIKARLKDRGFLITGLGLAVYDFYGRKLRSTPKSRMLRGKRLRRAMPGLASNIIGAGLYYEGHITHAERLGLELVLDAEAFNPLSMAVNHATLLGSEPDGVLHYSSCKGERRVRGKVIVNAGGAWIDRINATLGLPTKLMGGSRGSHLVVDSPALLAALGGRMVYFGTADGRVNLIYPFAGNVLVGSTDIPQPDPDTALCTDDEAAYLCAAVTEIFPDFPIRADQIRYRFSGVRPLPRSDAADIGAVTRDHSIATLQLPNSDVPILCLIGGKWTTFRSFSEQASNAVLAHLGRGRLTTTAGLAIGGGKGMPRDLAAKAALARAIVAETGAPMPRVLALLDRYGTKTLDYLRSLDQRPETPLPGCPDYSNEEIRHICQTERVNVVEDVLRRRTLISLTGRDSAEVQQAVQSILLECRQNVGGNPPIFSGAQS